VEQIANGNTEVSKAGSGRGRIVVFQSEFISLSCNVMFI